MRIEDLSRWIAPLKNRVTNMIARATVSAVDDAKKIQIVQLDLLEGETRDEIERLQNYGFTSNPRTGAEAAVIFVGGRRDHGLAIAVDDRRYRIANLESGEVAVFNDTGAKIVFKANGDIELTPKPGQKVKVSSNVEITGDVSATGTITGTTDVVGGGKSLKTHTHPASLTVAGTSPSGPVTGTATGSTGGPT
jgi:phage gp45-like